MLKNLLSYKFLVFHQQLPAPREALEIYSAQRQTMGSISSLVLMPSLLITLMFGLASMAAVPGFHSAPWAWGKLATTVLMLEGSLLGIHSPMKKEAELAASALADKDRELADARREAEEKLAALAPALPTIASTGAGPSAAPPLGSTWTRRRTPDARGRSR